MMKLKLKVKRLIKKIDVALSYKPRGTLFAKDTQEDHWYLSPHEKIPVQIVSKEANRIKAVYYCKPTDEWREIDLTPGSVLHNVYAGFRPPKDNSDSWVEKAKAITKVINKKEKKKMTLTAGKLKLKAKTGSGVPGKFNQKVFVGTIGKKQVLFDAAQGKVLAEVPKGNTPAPYARSKNWTYIKRGDASQEAQQACFRAWREARSN